MFALKTILCPVDFSPATHRQVDVAVDLCRAFGARLVLHHNCHSYGTNASVGWMYRADHRDNSESVAESKLQECLARVPKAVPAEGLVTQGPTSAAILAVSEQVGADVVILTTHGTKSEQHASVTEKALEHGKRAVLVLHEEAVESNTPRFAAAITERQAVIIATDLGAESQAALALAFDLARALPIELHLVLLPGKGNGGSTDDDAQARVRALIPADVVERTRIHVEHGDAAKGITRLAEDLSASCIMMAERTRSPKWLWFSEDVSRAVLHRAKCPIWYVPAGFRPKPAPATVDSVLRTG